MDEQRSAWSARIDEARDLHELERIDGQLAGMSDGWARPMRFKIGLKRSQLRKGSATMAAFSAATVHPGKDFDLPVPDGRPLYAYRLDEERFGRIQDELGKVSSMESLQTGVRPALFALWASEWFRRCYRGEGLVWAKLLAPLGFRLNGTGDHRLLQNIVRRGLEQWRRDVLRLKNEHFLGSLAREGGFPAAAVEDGGSDWARGVLEVIVRRLLGEATAGEERAIELAEAQRGRLPQIFRDDDFVQLCADLALAVVNIRREAEPLAAGQGLPLTAWLAINRPGWRDALPLTTGEQAADALIERLMTTKAVTGAGVGVTRLLVREDRQWFEGVRIALDGEMDVAAMRRIGEAEGRLRAFACGDLARHLPGELGMLEPPGQNETIWSARSSQLARGISRVPFSAAIELELRAGERLVDRIDLPGGKPRRGRLIVAELEEGTPDRPEVLRIVGSGSGQYRSEQVFLQVPDTWSVTATTDEEAALVGPGVGATGLWRVLGGAFVIDDVGDRHRIRCGQAADRTQRIELHGDPCRWAEFRGDLDVYCGAVIPRTSRPEGSLQIRHAGGKWRPAPSRLPVGTYDLGWIHERIVLDRRRVAVLPQGAVLQRFGIGDSVRYELEGFDGVSLTPSADAPVRISSDCLVWTAKAGRKEQARFEATLQFVDGGAVPLTIDYPCAAGIARWDGTIQSPHETITLDTLRDFVAVADGRMELFAELHEPGRRRCAELNWRFDRELPLASIARDLAGLLLPATIDAWVTLGMHDGIETYWRIDPFPLRLNKESSGLVASRGVLDEAAQLCGRSMADPCHEVELGSYSLLSEANHRPVRLPDALRGPWLVYLKAGDTILSRPIVDSSPLPVIEVAGALGRAMSVGPWRALNDALDAFLVDAARPDAKGHVDDLIALAQSLRGLPPATMLVFDKLPGHPQVLARMAYNAKSEERDAVLLLCDALPFSWYAIPRDCWDKARLEVFDRMLGLVSMLPNPAQVANESVGLITAAIIERVPLLQPVLDEGETYPLETIVQSFLNRAFDRVHGLSRGRYRMRLRGQLPARFEDFDPGVLDTLDAPCAAALAVAGCWVPGIDDVRHMETVSRTCPRYFAEAFAAWLKEIR